MQNPLPHLEISRDIGLSIRLPLHARHEQQQCGSGAERRPRRIHSRIGGVKRVVEALQPLRVDKVLLLALIDSGKSVEIGGQPTFVLRKQAGDELLRPVGASSNQIFPRRLGRPSARYRHPSGANADMASVKIVRRSHRQEFFEPNRLTQVAAGFSVVARHRPVKTRQIAITEQRGQQAAAIFSTALLADGGPIRFCKQHGNARRRIRVAERLAALQRLFELG